MRPGFQPSAHAVVFNRCRQHDNACAFYAMLRPMFDLRHVRQVRRASRLLAVCLAYALAVQSVVASVGTGMSAFAGPGPVICGASATPAPGKSGDRQTPNPAPSCPFCFVAAQTAGHVALTGAAPPVPAYAGLVFAAEPNPVGRGIFVPVFRRTTGDPRAPPIFSA